MTIELNLSQAEGLLTLLHNSNKDVSEELDEKASSQLPDAAAPTLEQQPAKDSSKDTSQQ